MGLPGLGCVRKFSRNKGATQRFARDSGGQKLWYVGFIRGLLLEPSSSKVGLWNLLPPRLRRETFGNEKFGEALALRSVLIATREAQSCGKLVGFAACLRDLLSPTWAAKILRTEFLARHRRHAAFRLRRGGARAKSSRYIAPGFVTFAGRGAQKP